MIVVNKKKTINKIIKKNKPSKKNEVTKEVTSLCRAHFTLILEFVYLLW